MGCRSYFGPFRQGDFKARQRSCFHATYSDCEVSTDNARQEDEAPYL
jgi:hypothetical protein